MTIQAALQIGACALTAAYIYLIIKPITSTDPTAEVTSWTRTAVKEWIAVTIIGVLFGTFFIVVTFVDESGWWLIPGIFFLIGAWISAGCVDYAIRYRRNFLKETSP